MRCLVSILSLFLLALTGCSPTPARPNILILLVDDLGWRDFGPFGQDLAETPNIDAFAKQSVRFTAAYSAGPVCSPTRAAIITGQYPARVNINDWIPGTRFPKAQTLPPPDLDQLPLEQVTLAEALRGAGYSTFHVGKWHLGGAGFLPQDQGFDVNIMGSHIGHPASHFFPYGNSLDSKPAASHAVPLPTLERRQDEYLADRQADEAITLLRNAATQTRPFFMHLSFYAIHTPWEAPAALIEKYQARARQRPGGDKIPRAQIIAAAMIETTDRAIGRVLDELHASGMDANTLVFLTSDNGGLGPASDNRPLRGQKRSLWEGGIRVPLMVRWPGLNAPGAIVSEPVISQDLFATACDAAGVPVGAEVKEDARALTPLLRGRAVTPAREAIFWHFPHNETAQVGPRGAVRRGQLKLIEEYQTGERLLFDLSADPSETTNVAAKFPDTAAQLAQLLHAWRERVGAKMPTPNPQADHGAN
ncbi:MAG: sulfatase [Phycisphaerales bacterium]|nr:sulfatase [Phycisphaerales bacterium]